MTNHTNLLSAAVCALLLGACTPAAVTEAAAGTTTTTEPTTTTTTADLVVVDNHRHLELLLLSNGWTSTETKIAGGVLDFDELGGNVCLLARESDDLDQLTGYMQLVLDQSDVSADSAMTSEQFVVLMGSAIMVYCPEEAERLRFGG